MCVSIHYFRSFGEIWGSLSNTIFGSMNGISGICPTGIIVDGFPPLPPRVKGPGSPARGTTTMRRNAKVGAGLGSQKWMPYGGLIKE